MPIEPQNFEQPVEETLLFYPVDADILGFKFSIFVRYRVAGEKYWGDCRLESRPFIVRFVEPKDPKEREAMVLTEIFLKERSPRDKKERQLLRRYGILLNEYGEVCTERWRYARIVRDAFPHSIYGGLAGYWLVRELGCECLCADDKKQKKLWYERTVSAYRWVIQNWRNTWLAYRAKEDFEEFLQEYEEEE